MDPLPKQTVERAGDAPLVYPTTRIEEVQDTLAGVAFADPYRWLERDSEEVQDWQAAQSELASSYVRQSPAFERVRELVRRFSVERRVVLPRFAGGSWFRAYLPEGASQAQARVASEPTGDGRVLFDPINENRKRPPFLSWVSPSPDGRTLALGVCMDGSESNAIRLIDVATARELPDPPPQTLMDNWTGGAQWLPDSSGFFFTAITGHAVDFVQHVYLHRRVHMPTTTRVEVAWTTAKEWRMVTVSRDGRYAVALERLLNPIPVAVAALGEFPLRWRPFVTSISGTVAGHLIGDRYISVTDVDAARGRLVAIPMTASDPNDTRLWQELVPESDATLRTVTPVGEMLYLTEFVDTYARVRIVDFQGTPLGEVPLPGRGAISELPFPIMNMVPKGHPDVYLFAYSSLTASWGIYSHTPGDRQIETLQEPRVRLKNAVVEDRCAFSTDGTRIPYQIVRATGTDSGRSQPTLIYAYGGFNVPELPQFPGPMATIVALGGVFVLAHLRGGSEFGRDWWQGGRLQNKQNCYSDLYAVAEDLISSKRSIPDLLAVVGGSNGGLMAGVAATQRPELWKAVVPRVPLLDLIGACREAYGKMCVTMEYADVGDPDEVRRLADFSPYHLIRDGIKYPAVFIDAGNTDPRCPPWHARKFAARLQAATSSSAPVLLRVWENVGHGWATDRTTEITEHAEWLTFVLRQLGLEPSPEK